MKLTTLPLRVSLFLVLAVVVTSFCGLVYGTVQQNYRQSANDPQVQISQYVANLLSQGGDVASVLPQEQADLSNSLATFIIVYDGNGQSTASSAKLDGQIPVLPKGVLDSANSTGQNRLTWQPKEGVRIASVVTKYDRGYVLAGRSLREVEARIDMLTKEVMLVWVLTLGIVFLGIWFLIPKKAK